MIRVKDGFGKLIGTTAAGSAGKVLLSNGGDSEFLRSKTYINNTGEVNQYKKITITNSSTEGFVIWIHSRQQHYLLNSGANAMSTPMNVFWELGTNYNNSTTTRVINIKAVATASSAKVVLYAFVKAYTYIQIVSPGEINIEDSTKEDYDAITSSTSGWIACKTANWADTKNTAGATNSADKMYLIGATSQGANPQTYSNTGIHATNGTLTASKFIGTLEGNVTGTSTNATNVDIATLSTNDNFPLLFTTNVTAGNKRIYTDTANELKYNPLTNTLISTYFDGKLKPRLVFGSGTSAKNKYILIGEYNATSAWHGFHGLFHFIGIENTNIGTLYLTMRTGNKVETLDFAKAIWTTLNDTQLINSIYITQTDNTVDGIIKSKTFRIYILWPYTYKYTAIVCPYWSDTNFTFVGDIVDNYTGTLASQSEHNLNYFKTIQCPNGGVAPNAYADTLTINHDEIVKVTGSNANNTITLSHATSGVTVSSYGPSANVTPNHGGTFSVPYFTVNAQGHITAASTKTITLPADNNTDTKVKQTAKTDNVNYPILLGKNGGTSGTAYESYYDSGVTLNPSTNTIAADISGNAATATSLVSTDSRSVEDTPTTYNKGLYAAFKYNGINAMSDGGSFYGLIHFRPYGSNTNFSGGYPHQLAFTENQNIWYRKAKNATEWHDWEQLAFLSDLSSYATTTYVNTAIANAQLDGSNVTIPVVDVKVKNSASSSAVTVINANKEAIIDLSTYAKLADLPKSLPLTPILTYDAISPIGAYAYENANGDASTNGFLFSNTSAAFGWGKSNCQVVLAARAGQSTPTVFIKQYYQSWGDWYALVHSGNVNDYAPKWDGTNAKGTWNISILGKASGITGYTFKTLSAKSHSGWTNNTTDDKIIPTMSMLAFWNGAHTSSGASNLTYCTKGAFGDAAIKGVTTAVTNGDTNLVTSGGVYSYINTISTAYLPLAGGTLTGNLNFNSQIPITWTGGTYQQRINTIDDAVTGTDVFQFQQSSDSGTNWKTLLSIKDEGTINLTGGDIPNLSAYWQSPTIMQSDNIAQTIWIGTGSPMSYSQISGNNKQTIFDQTITVGTNNKLFINFEIPSLVVGLRGGYDTASADEWSILLTPTYYIYLNGTLYKTISEPGYVIETNTNNNVSVRIEIKISYPQLSTGDVFQVQANGPYYSSQNNLAIQLTGVINVNYEECANSNVYNQAVSIVNKEGFLICDTAKTNITYSNSDMFFIKRGSKCFKITNDGVQLSSDEGISWKQL